MRYGKFARGATPPSLDSSYVRKVCVHSLVCALPVVEKGLSASTGKRCSGNSMGLQLQKRIRWMCVTLLILLILLF